MKVLRDIGTIVESNEIMLIDLPVNGKDRYHKKKIDNCIFHSMIEIGFNKHH